MKKLKYSIIFSFFIILSHLFQKEIKSLIKTSMGADIINYLVFGLMIPFLIIVMIKVILKKNDEKITTALVIIGIVLYFFIIRSQTQLFTKLSLFEFIILGIIFSFENNNRRSLIPLLIILLSSVFAVFASHRSFSISFYHYDIFLKCLLGFVGYTAASIGFRR